MFADDDAMFNRLSFDLRRTWCRRACSRATIDRRATEPAQARKSSIASYGCGQPILRIGFDLRRVAVEAAVGARWNLDAISAAFAEAAIDPSRWDAAMEIASDATESFGAVLLPLKGRLPYFPQSRSLAAASESYVKDGWIQHDDRFQCMPALVRNGVATEFDFTNADQIAREPYWQEFLAPHGLRWFAGVHVACGDEQWALSIQRTIAQGPFTPHGVEQLAVLSKKLGSAAALARARLCPRRSGAASLRGQRVGGGAARPVRARAAGQRRGGAHAARRSAHHPPPHRLGRP
jgi:hypothetical protein